MREAGATPQQLADRLTLRGVALPPGGRWHLSAARSILNRHRRERQLVQFGTDWNDRPERSVGTPSLIARRRVAAGCHTGKVKLDDSDLSALVKARSFAAGYAPGPSWIDDDARTATVHDSDPVAPLNPETEALLAKAAVARARRLARG